MTEVKLSVKGAVERSGASDADFSAKLETKSAEPETPTDNDKDRAAIDFRLICAAKAVDARISLWTCFYRFVIGVHHAEMARSDFRSKREFAKWAKSVNLAFQLPRAYALTGKPGQSPRKYYRALTQFWCWYLILFARSSAITVVKEAVGFGLAVRNPVKAARGAKSVLRDEGLTGELFELQQDDYECLREAGYPSLFVAHGKCYILAGPLSLVNERCSLAKTYLQWGCNPQRNEVWLKTREGGHVFAAGERLWTRYEFGKRCVEKGECFCPDAKLH